MKYAVKISELNINKFVENLSNLIKKSSEQGLDPNNTLVVVDLLEISNDVEIVKK
jgi:hypothetical protein